MSLLRRQEPPGGSPVATPSSNQTLPSSTSAAPAPTTTQTTSSSSSPRPAVLGAIIGSVAVIIGLVLLFYLLRHLRAKNKDPKYIPTKFLKKLWTRWDPDPVRYRLPDNNDSLEPISTRGTSRSRVTTANSNAVASNPTVATAGVDRNTSVRSVMTLPAYNPTALHTEQVLGREGERGGIDMVLEFPENADEEEGRREEEMEALYQVRLARRRENEEREERRTLRREARERGDFVALRAINERARSTSNANAGQTVEELRAEHDRIKKERLRAVSSVSYADLGVARHDGTRLRSNSHDSERAGLLGDAASIAASSHYHHRQGSTSSIHSLDTMQSDMPSPRLTRSRANSRANASPRVSSQTERPGTSHTGQAGSSPEIIEHEDVPPHSPPEYENISLGNPAVPTAPTEPPPDYSSPVVGRGEAPAQFPPSSDEQRDSDMTATQDASEEGRRRSQLGHLVSESRTSSAGSSGSGSPRGKSGGAPHLPSLRLNALPSIQVDPGTPVVRREQSTGGDVSRSSST